MHFMAIHCLVIFIILNSKLKIILAKHGVPDQMPHYVTSDLDLPYLPLDRPISNFRDVW